MSPRLVTRFLPLLIVGAVALSTRAKAQDRYGSEYDHHRHDRHEAQHHRSDDRRESFGHALGDLFRYGTTDRYSSPDHYYRDQRRDYEHSLRDQSRALDHYRRDRWGAYRNDKYDRNDYRDGDRGYSRDGHDHRR